MGFPSIGNKLKSLGYKTRRGSGFAGNVVYRIMMNKVHTGYYEQTIVGETLSHKIIWKEGHGPYITEEQFKCMKRIANERSTGQVEYFHESRYLLSGLLVCGECNKKLRLGTKRYMAKDGEHVYLTYTHKPYDPACNARHKVSLVDNNVIGELMNMVGNANYIKELMENKNIQETVKPSEEDFSEIKVLRGKLLNRKSKILDLYMDEDWTKEELLKKKKEIDTELQALANREEEFNNRLKSSEEKDIDIDYLADSLQIIKVIGTGEIPPREENSILKDIISEIIISKDGIVKIKLMPNNANFSDSKYHAHQDVWVTLPQIAAR